jgi:hypothetical protein
MKPKTHQFAFRVHIKNEASYPFRTFQAAKEFARRQFPEAMSYITYQNGNRIWIRKDGHETESFEGEKDTA